MRLQLEEQITIRVPAEQIFAYLNEVKNRSDFIPLLEEVILLDEPPIRPGSRYIEVATIAGQQLKTTYQVTEIEENKKISVKTLKSVFPIRVDLLLLEREIGTLVKIRLDFELKGIYRLASPLIRGIVQQQAGEILRRLKGKFE